MHDLWKNGNESVHSMRVVNTDSKYHSAKIPEKCLQEEEWTKKKMYVEVCLQQRRKFSPFTTSVDGILGVEAVATLESIPRLLVTKWRHP